MGSVKSISKFTTEEIDLFIWSSGIRMQSLKTVCLHHQKMYLDQYAKLNTYCCDPIGSHVDNKYIKRGLCEINHTRTYVLT